MPSEHTPGPWALFPNMHCVRQADGPGIAMCSMRAWSDDVNAANAAFIVRACNAHDDLLIACQLALETIDRLYPLDWQGTKSNLRAAIARAEGKEPVTP